MLIDWLEAFYSYLPVQFAHILCWNHFSSLRKDKNMLFNQNVENFFFIPFEMFYVVLFNFNIFVILKASLLL